MSRHYPAHRPAAVRQDELLHRLQEAGGWATLYLQDGTAMPGRIVDFDQFVILLEASPDLPPAMIYKSSVVSLQSGRGAPREPRPRGGMPQRRRPRPPHAAEPRPDIPEPAP